ncbi:SDR family NAD(P)-dependent oxidoreductase [Actinoallomurus purpureus]|uniref:SDR family NAD(P)-dependent oxidoreductase n=1 Tax=Actinoallomurus purpureus TaxID=478114 RepID=UPI002093706E|nr:SDR family NAD(P)-dependent oxidoreductase [Actinoallomurus purpureus]MCO6010410.1 SDR family NAD(P)-dependent oxidoreductase [Actinoallomurus purpureus]
MGVSVVVDPDRPGSRPGGSGTVPDQAEIDACLRVMGQARAAHPDDPGWAAVHEAATQLYRAGKKARKASRHADRRRHDREATAAATRYQEQDPAPEPGPPGDRPVTSTRSERRPVSPSHGPAPTMRSPEQDPALRPGSPGDRPAGAGRSLVKARRCYVCKTHYRLVHPEYHLLCPACAEENLARRHARCDLRGRRAIVTGGRVKIGFQLALKLLRDGAEVLVTTRFPRDAARRFAAVPDAPDWLDRLRVHGVDLLDLAAVAGLLEAAHREFPSLDILVNNAAQTIRRPGVYHREVRVAESEPLTGLAARIDVTDAAAVTGEPALPAPAAAAGRPDRSPGGIGADDGTTAVAAWDDTLEALFPAGRTDETGQPLDLRDRNSWSLRLHEVDPAEWLEVQMVNSFAPFLLTSRLRGLLEASPWPDRYVVQVSAMEGSFSRGHKTVRHPHTNMAKAALNMLTRTSAPDYAASGISMNSVDTGWVTDERPHPDKTVQREAGFRPPLDVIDGAARVYDPIVRGVGGERLSGLFLKDYRPVDW